jgi:hypothetical protein
MSYTEKDCKYWHHGKCYLAKSPGVLKIGDPYFDSVHDCDCMTVPCFDDAIKPSARMREGDGK